MRAIAVPKEVARGPPDASDQDRRALRRVGEQLGIHPETRRNWVSRAEIDEGHLPGVTTAEGQRIADSNAGP